MTLTERDTLILEAALEFGADYFYHIKNGTLGITLYIEAPNKALAGKIRKKAPGFWKGLYVVVLYSAEPDFREEDLPDPKSA